MKRIYSMACGAVIFAVIFCSCSGREKRYTREEWEALQGIGSTTTPQESMYTLPAELLITHSEPDATVSTQATGPAAEKTQKPTQTAKATKTPAPTKAPASTKAPMPTKTPTRPLPTEPPAPTKPKLTAEIEDQVIKDIVYAHREEIWDIENRHEAALEVLNKEAADFEVYYLTRVRQLNEFYSSQGLLNSGTHKQALQQLDNQRMGYYQRIQEENRRYEQEKEELSLMISQEVEAYIQANYDTSP